MHIWKREFLFNILKIALKSLKKWVHHCLFNVYLTKMDSTDILKNVPVSLGSSNISLEKGNPVSREARTVFRPTGRIPCYLEKACNADGVWVFFLPIHHTQIIIFSSL